MVLYFAHLWRLNRVNNLIASVLLDNLHHLTDNCFFSCVWGNGEIGENEWLDGWLDEWMQYCDNLLSCDLEEIWKWL